MKKMFFVSSSSCNTVPRDDRYTFFGLRISDKKRK